MRTKTLWSPNGFLLEQPGRPSLPQRIMLFSIAGIIGVVFLALSVAFGTQAVFDEIRIDHVTSNPINAEGVVVEPYINGFGGDPYLKYIYIVDGKTYAGDDEANYKLDVLTLEAGQLVAIQYAADDPSKSCLCRP